MKSTRDSSTRNGRKHAAHTGTQSNAHGHAADSGKHGNPSKTNERSGHTSAERSGAKSHERGTRGGAHEHTTHSPIGIQKALKGASYPARRQALLDTAQANGADDATLRTLRDLPDDEYDTPAAVSKAVGHEME